ncbi:unnamed protein product [Staurois parvus]|uniref:Uncharacterized protein n=1 Tax=Staurois parvus TaxID=386267 RepID=A0ABN9DBU0_9NEOB|nr:unnamed protein product [Staurois parvus]
MGALLMRVEVSKRSPASTACAHSLGVRSTAIADHCAGPLCEVPIHVITDWPIRDHMQRSKQDVTCDIIAYYV